MQVPELLRGGEPLPIDWSAIVVHDVGLMHTSEQTRVTVSHAYARFEKLSNVVVPGVPERAV